ncbi:MAG: hypothetical protein Q7Q71_13015 [Verrucomicrobiota bacterium JB023]|nr:hypothetical protein [Verrucomicrobiota bacterium JB023]
MTESFKFTTADSARDALSAGRCVRTAQRSSAGEEGEAKGRITPRAGLTAELARVSNQLLYQTLATNPLRLHKELARQWDYRARWSPRSSNITIASFEESTSFEAFQSGTDERNMTPSSMEEESSTATLLTIRRHQSQLTLHEPFRNHHHLTSAPVGRGLMLPRNQVSATRANRGDEQPLSSN